MMTNCAKPEHPVIKEIVRRYRSGSGDIGRASNTTKLGLVVEGGGMRGIYSGAVLVAMEEMGLTDVFDEVYGESAGVINACYFLAGQAKFGISVYLDELRSLRFFNPFRLGAILDIDYAIDVVVKSAKPLRTERVLSSRSNLYVALTNVLTGEPRLVAVKREGIPLLTLLKATGAIAPLYNRSVLIDGVPYVDGGITNPIPVRSAVENGCTHVLVLLTQEPNFVARQYSAFQRFCLRPFLKTWPPAFVDAFYGCQHKRYNESREIVFRENMLSQDVNIAFIGPQATSPFVSRATKARRRLEAAMSDAVYRTRTVFVGLGAPMERTNLQ